MFGRYEDFYKNFYIKKHEELKERLVKLPGNKIVIKQLTEIKQLLYKNWFILLDGDKEEEINLTETKPKEIKPKEIKFKQLELF